MARTELVRGTLKVVRLKIWECSRTEVPTVEIRYMLIYLIKSIKVTSKSSNSAVQMSEN
jgi:hypothetical protein